MVALVYLALAAGLCGLLVRLLRPSAEERPAALLWLGYALLLFVSARTVFWLYAEGLFGPDELPPRLPLSRTWATWRLTMVAAAAAFASLRGWRGALMGALCGFLFCALGFCSYRWLIVAQAWKLAGSFAGSLLLWTLPFWLAGSCAALALALLHPGLEGYRGRVAAAILLAWYAGAIVSHRSLETVWDFGPRSLAQAVGLAEGRLAPSVAVAWLKPSGLRPYVLEERRAEVDGLDVSQPGLVRLYEYLEARQYRSLFLKQGLKLLRQGWLFWWDPERALKASALSFPGRVVPDYRGALGLLKAGPQTRERFGILQGLAERAKPRKEGFEDVTQSQYIFEGFSGAYARFGDEDQARWWLVKIDNLWPIYDKRIEVTPIESAHDGEVSGSVLLASAPAQGLLVGLFYVGISTQAEAFVSSGTLSDSMRADADGRFRFLYLGPGRYYLGLQGDPEILRGPIHGSPGVFEITEAAPVAHLPPVIIDRP